MSGQNFSSSTNSACGQNESFDQNYFPHELVFTLLFPTYQKLTATGS